MCEKLSHDPDLTIAHQFGVVMGLTGLYIRTMGDLFEHIASRYRLELLPSVPAFFRKARIGKSLSKGQLVYYGPMPGYYGIGEIKHIEGRFVAVDFRGTGSFGVHEDVLEQQYVIPIPSTTLSRL